MNAAGRRGRRGYPAFVWQDKAILRRICQEVEDRGSCLAVYYALCWVASDKESEVFQTTHKWLAHLSGFSPATVKRRVGDLERIKAVEVYTPALHAPCTYRMLAPQGGVRALAHHDLTMAHHELTIAHGEGGSVSYIRSTTEKHSTNSISDTQKTQISETWLRELSNDLAYRGLDIPGELSKARRWCETNRRQCTPRFFLNWLNRCQRPRATANDTAALQAQISDRKAALARETNPEAGKRLEAELAALTAQIAG